MTRFTASDFEAFECFASNFVEVNSFLIQRDFATRHPRYIQQIIDETSQIGIVDLKTCIQTVVTASPELVSKLDSDFTIYAYDYSEQDTPLVGQGMLSWALTTSQASMEDEEVGMVTGRVTKNVMGVFSRSAQQTLEVKLRLVPVPTSTQADYLN
ncbi:hypothetical protein EON80_22120, partial [bacterium]